MPAKDPRSAEIDQMILEVYPIQGPKPIMERFGLSKGAVYARANKLRILADPSRHASGTRDPRRDEIDQMIREVYSNQGPDPIMGRFELTKNVVQTHAKLLGVKINRETRQNEILKMIQEVYPKYGPKPIAERFGLSIGDIYRRARLNGIYVVTIGQHERASQTKTDLFDTLDLHLWIPELTSVGAYYLGLAWADATMAFVRPQDAIGRWSRYHVAFSQSGEEDKEVVYFLANKLGLPDSRVRQVKKYKDSHKHPYRLKLSGKRIASLFIDHFGIPMRKSFVDPPYPNIPDNRLIPFARGLFDGDGSSVYEWGSSYCAPPYRFYGTTVFLESFRERMQKILSFRIPSIRPHCDKLSVFDVCAIEAVRELTLAMHAEREQGIEYPFMSRKHRHFMEFSGLL
jgi:hypothetical protein